MLNLCKKQSLLMIQETCSSTRQIETCSSFVDCVWEHT